MNLVYAPDPARAQKRFAVCGHLRGRYGVELFQSSDCGTRKQRVMRLTRRDHHSSPRIFGSYSQRDSSSQDQVFSPR